jgi:phosphoglucosamine mutase
MAEIWRTGEMLNTLKKGMEKYPQTLVNVAVGSNVDISTLKPVQNTKREIEGELGSSGRVLLRPSGTEPLIRVMVEGQDGELVDEMANRLADVVGSAMA